MDLKTSVEILAMEKLCAESDLKNGRGNIRTEEFIDAVDTVLMQLYEYSVSSETSCMGWC